MDQFPALELRFCAALHFFPLFFQDPPLFDSADPDPRIRTSG